MPPAVGWKSTFGVGDESAWGTAVARTKFFEHEGFDAGEDWPFIEYPAFIAGSPLAHDRGMYSIKPELKVPVVYTGLEYLWMHAFGKAPTVATPGGGTLARTQTYVFDDNTAKKPGLTGEAAYLAPGSTIKAYTLSGMKVAGFTLEWNLDGFMEMTMTFLGKAMDQIGSPTSPTYPADRLPISWGHVAVKKNGVAVPYRSGSIEYDSGIELRPQVGSYLGVEPVQVRKRSVVVKFTTDFEDPTVWRDLMAGTSPGTAPTETAARIQVVATHPNANSIESGQAYSWDWDMKSCFSRNPKHSVSDFGIVPGEYEFVSEKDASGNDIAILITKNKVTAVP
jgi:hypothetical protein